MPYKQIQLSYDFLAGMIPIVNPKLTGNGPWVCTPYTVDKINGVLIAEQANKDFHRDQWHLGPRVPGDKHLNLIGNRYQNLSPEQTKDNVINELAALSGVGCSNDVRNSLKESDKLLDLTLEESAAILAFCHSIGDEPVVIQAGSIRGLTQNCFYANWLQIGHGLTHADQEGVYAEDQRIERKEADKKTPAYIKISSCLEAKNALFMESDVTMLSQNGEPLYKFYNEQHLMQVKNKKGETTFSLVPHQVELQVQPIFWDALVSAAGIRLATLNVLEDKDLFAFIPLLENEAFRAQFIEKLKKCPLKRINFAEHWIKICYKQDPETFSKISSSMPGVAFKIKRCLKAADVAIYQTAVTHPWKTAACIGGIVLGVVGAILTATGVLAPLGVALGYAGVAIASPATAAAVGTFLGALAVGLVSGVVKLGKSIAACFKSRQPEEPQQIAARSSPRNSSTASAFEAGLGNSENQEEVDHLVKTEKNDDVVKVKMRPSISILTEDSEKSDDEDDERKEDSHSVTFHS